MRTAPILFWTNPDADTQCFTRPVRVGDLMSLRCGLPLQGTKRGTPCVVLGPSSDGQSFELNRVSCLLNEEIIDISVDLLEIFNENR